MKNKRPAIRPVVMHIQRLTQTWSSPDTTEYAPIGKAITINGRSVLDALSIDQLPRISKPVSDIVFASEDAFLREAVVQGSIPYGLYRYSFESLREYHRYYRNRVSREAGQSKYLTGAFAVASA